MKKSLVKSNDKHFFNFRSIVGQRDNDFIFGRTFSVDSCRVSHLCLSPILVYKDKFAYGELHTDYFFKG